ncbi:MAG: alpha-rhamnosidase [Bacteroidetes bacterium]|nr:alpha-rhamnosidase [Bacteroidota bacterium]
MKHIKLGFITILIMFTIGGLTPGFSQQYIGCRTSEGWAETPMLRKSIVLKASDFKHWDFQTLAFTAEINSLGYHELYVNGVKVGDEVLQPAVSQLDKQSLKISYDITPYVHKGKNEILLWLGQGWGRIYGAPAVVRAEILRTVSDGECGEAWTLASTDNSWEASPSGYSYTGSWQPLQFGGEHFDARIKPDWKPATEFEAKDMAVSWQHFEGNHIIDTLIPIIKKGETESLMLDFGRVITGWFQADFMALAEGSKVTMEYFDDVESKVQNPEPYSEKDFYIANGSGEEFFTNRFHYHAFRYVRITGADIKTARALQISAVNPKEGATFECSDSRLNAIHDLVKYTLSCLTYSGYMVDCPHLERMGYGGDGNSSTMSLQTMYNVRNTYRNWMTAWGDAIDSTGDLPYVAPAFRTGGGPYWSGFIIKAPWRTYLNYGDVEIIAEHYHEMKQWLLFIQQHCEDEILQPWPDTERHTWFLGDWLAPEGVDIKGESVLHVNSCFISECLGDMIQMARIMGCHKDVQEFTEWRSRLNAAIHRHFYHPETHSYANGTPLDQAYALLMNIPPDSTTATQVKEQLIKDCYGKYKAHIAVGLVGVPIFTEWCIRERKTELMATILRQPDYPGYLYMINNGASTTWESWNGKRSRVHNCYNGIGIWFYQALAGIRPDPEQPGYKHFFIDPQRCEGIDWIRASKPTPYGTISVDINGDSMCVNIPESTTATLFPDSPYQKTLTAGKHNVILLR